MIRALSTISIENYLLPMRSTFEPEPNARSRSRSGPLGTTVKFSVRVRQILPELDVNRTSRTLIVGGDSTESSSSGVDESRVAPLDFVRLAHEHGDGRCLYETNSSDLGVDPEFWGDGDVLCKC